MKTKLTQSLALIIILVFMPNQTNAAEYQPSNKKMACKVIEAPDIFNRRVIKLLKYLSVTWDGQCKSGFASGHGKLEWFANSKWHKGGLKFWIERFSKDHGMLLKEGEKIGIVQSNQIQIKIRIHSNGNVLCEKNSSYRGIRVDIPYKLDARQKVVINNILSISERFAWRECPIVVYKNNTKKIKLSNVDVDIYQNKNKVATARSYDKREGGHHWFEYSPIAANKSASDARDIIYSAYDLYLKKQKQAKKEERKKQILAQQEKKKQMKKHLIEKYKIESWIKIESLGKNPFRFEGKTIGIRGTLNQMKSRTEGLFSEGFFGYFIVSDIPKKLIIPEQTILIFGKVLGNIETSTRFGKTSLPHLKFIGMYVCENYNCSDIL